MAASATSLGTRIRLASGALPVDHEVLDDRERGRPPRLHHDLVAVGELAHVELAGGGAFRRPVRAPVDHHRARSADALAAVVVEGDRLLAGRDPSLVDDVEHLEERHLGADVLGVDLLERTGGAGAGLSPDSELEVHDVRALPNFRGYS
jgi:hypothetical protein